MDLKSTFIPESKSGGHLEPEIEFDYKNGVIFLGQGNNLISINQECAEAFIKELSKYNHGIIAINKNFKQEYT